MENYIVEIILLYRLVTSVSCHAYTLTKLKSRLPAGPKAVKNKSPTAEQSGRRLMVVTRLGSRGTRLFTNCLQIVRPVPLSVFAQQRGIAVMSAPKVYVTRRIHDEAMQLLSSKCQVTRWDSDELVPRDELIKGVKGVDAVLCMLTDKIDSEVLDAAGKFATWWECVMRIIYMVIYLVTSSYNMLY